MEIEKNKRYYYDGVITSIEEFASHKQEKWVLSSYTAASLWGFNNKMFTGIHLTFPKGDVSKKFEKYRKNERFHIKQRTGKFYSEGIVRIECEGKVVLAYEPERAFVEIIKEEHKRLDDTLISLIIKFYSTSQFDYQKLMKYADLFGIREIIEMSQALAVQNAGY